MHPKTLPVFRNISFNPAPVETYIPMEPMHPLVFDRLCEDGWCYWSDLIFRRNYWEWRGHPCRVVLLRIDLRNFSLTKSQRKCLRRNKDLKIYRRPLVITAEHEALFHQHAERLPHHRPQSIFGFFSNWSDIMPCRGELLDVYDKGELIATSFYHLGWESMAGNYCIFRPEETARSLGQLTMLLEIQLAQLSGRRYYYPGFVYDLPSEFDYKLNFNGLEYFDWWGNWYPLERLPVRSWREQWSVAPPLTDEEMEELRRQKQEEADE
ncbi:MAG: hypothetical protein U0U46_20345 [Saprospiraceae bacterium]